MQENAPKRQYNWSMLEVGWAMGGLAFLPRIVAYINTQKFRRDKISDFILSEY